MCHYINVTRVDPPHPGALREDAQRDGPASVIPKVFHQPLADYTKDAAISATMERELEQELTGWAELEAIASDSCRPTVSDAAIPGPIAGDGCEGRVTVMIGGFPAAHSATRACMAPQSDRD